MLSFVRSIKLTNCSYNGKHGLFELKLMIQSIPIDISCSIGMCIAVDFDDREQLTFSKATFNILGLPLPNLYQSNSDHIM